MIKTELETSDPPKDPPKEASDPAADQLLSLPTLRLGEVDPDQQVAETEADSQENACDPNGDVEPTLVDPQDKAMEENDHEVEATLPDENGQDQGVNATVADDVPMEETFDAGVDKSVEAALELEMDNVSKKKCDRDVRRDQLLMRAKKIEEAEAERERKKQEKNDVEPKAKAKSKTSKRGTGKTRGRPRKANNPEPKEPQAPEEVEPLEAPVESASKRRRRKGKEKKAKPSAAETAKKAEPTKKPKQASKAKAKEGPAEEPARKRSKRHPAPENACVDQALKLEMAAVLLRFKDKSYDKEEETLHKGKYNHCKIVVYWNRDATGIKTFDGTKWAQVAYFAGLPHVVLAILAASKFAKEVHQNGPGWATSPAGTLYQRVLMLTGRALSLDMASHMEP